MQTLSMKVTEDLNRTLSDLARQRGISKSALIREAITELVARERPGRPASGSFLAAAEDLAGCVDGPEDLSTNVEHLAGYGR